MYPYPCRFAVVLSFVHERVPATCIPAMRLLLGWDARRAVKDNTRTRVPERARRRSARRRRAARHDAVGASALTHKEGAQQQRLPPPHTHTRANGVWLLLLLPHTHARGCLLLNCAAAAAFNGDDAYCLPRRSVEKWSYMYCLLRRKVDKSTRLHDVAACRLLMGCRLLALAAVLVSALAMGALTTGALATAAAPHRPPR